MEYNKEDINTIVSLGNKYRKEIHVHGWQQAYVVEKKDHYVYEDQLPNSFSTYDRWGTDKGTWSTETRDMQQQVFTKKEQCYNFRPLVNFTSYPCTDTPSRNQSLKKVMKEEGLPELPEKFGYMDYDTTYQSYYRNPTPCVIKPITMSSPPPLMFRAIRSDRTQSSGTAPPRGTYMFNDSHTPIGHIRKLRLERYKSFNPATCFQDFPNVDPEVFKEDLEHTSITIRDAADETR